MPKGIPADLVGQKFGRLTVVKMSSRRDFSQRWWVCKCKCGNTAEATTHSLRTDIRSCGCGQMRGFKKANATAKVEATRRKKSLRSLLVATAISAGYTQSEISQVMRISRAFFSRL